MPFILALLLAIVIMVIIVIGIPIGIAYVHLSSNKFFPVVLALGVAIIITFFAFLICYDDGMFEAISHLIPVFIAIFIIVYPFGWFIIEGEKQDELEKRKEDYQDFLNRKKKWERDNYKELIENKQRYYRTAILNASYVKARSNCDKYPNNKYSHLDFDIEQSHRKWCTYEEEKKYIYKQRTLAKEENKKYLNIDYENERSEKNKKETLKEEIGLRENIKKYNQEILDIKKNYDVCCGVSFYKKVNKENYREYYWNYVYIFNSLVELQLILWKLYGVNEDGTDRKPLDIESMNLTPFIVPETGEVLDYFPYPEMDKEFLERHMYD